jgi:hypothetical protein
MGNLVDELAKLTGVDPEKLRTKMASEATQERKAKRRAAEAEAAIEHSSQAPRYPGAEVLPLEEAREILESLDAPPANPKVDGVFDIETFTLPSVQIVRGDLSTGALHMQAEGSNLFVDGSLRVDGILKQDFRAGGLLVMGDIHAKHVVTTAEMACTGDLTVEGTLYGNCTNYGTNVWGRTKAKTVMSAKEHYFSFWGGADLDLLIDVYGDTPNLEEHDHCSSSMDEILRPEVGDAYEESVIFELLQAHGSILR